MARRWNETIPAQFVGDVVGDCSTLREVRGTVAGEHVHGNGGSQMDGPVKLVGEPETGKGRDDDVEPIGGITTEGGRIG